MTIVTTSDFFLSCWDHAWRSDRAVTVSTEKKLPGESHLICSSYSTDRIEIRDRVGFEIRTGRDDEGAHEWDWIHLDRYLYWTVFFQLARAKRASD